MLSVLTVVGARPQFVKAAVVSREIASRNGVRETLIHTGQHYSPRMSERFFGELGMAEPAENLAVGSGSHGAQTAAMLIGLEPILAREKPDWLLTYGDTNSTLASALVAAKLHVPIAHVEAGLRSFNRQMPEEVNRILTDHASTLLFAPTETAVTNLRAEGLSDSAVHLVGDVMYDAVRVYGGATRTVEGVPESGYILATLHRAENTDSPERLEAAFRGLIAVSDSMPVVLPLHPRTEHALKARGLYDEVSSRLQLLPPVGYLDMMVLLRGASVVATDSGGVQKEAYFHGVPCVTLRDETEWTELVDSGWNTLQPPNRAADVASTISTALRSGPPSKRIEAYGDGFAARRIVDALIEAGAD